MVAAIWFGTNLILIRLGGEGKEWEVKRKRAGGRGDDIL